MTTFDAAARPMFASMQSTPTLTPFEAEKPRIPLDTRNPAATAAARRSAEMDFSEEDRNDDDDLNAVIWAAIKGPNVPCPRPSKEPLCKVTFTVRGADTRVCGAPTHRGALSGPPPSIRVSTRRRSACAT